MLFLLITTSLGLTGKMYEWAAHENDKLNNELSNYSDSLLVDFDSANEGYPDLASRIEMARNKYIVAMRRYQMRIAGGLDSFARDLPDDRIELFIYDQHFLFPVILKKYKKIADHAINQAHLEIWRD